MSRDRPTTYVFAGYDHNGAFGPEVEALSKHRDVKVIRPKPGQTIQDAVAEMRRHMEANGEVNANIFLASHGSKDGRFEWQQNGSRISYSEFFAALPRTGLASVSIGSCYGGTSQDMLAHLPPGTLLQSSVGRDVLDFSSKIGGEIAAYDKITPLRILLESLDNVSPEDSVYYYRAYNTKIRMGLVEGPVEELDVNKVLPHLIGLGGNPPRSINLNTEMEELSRSARNGSLDLSKFHMAIGLVQRHFDGSDGLMDESNTQVQARVTSVAGKLRSGADTSRFTLEEKRVAYALTAANLYTTGEMQQMVAQARGQHSTEQQQEGERERQEETRRQQQEEEQRQRQEEARRRQQEEERRRQEETHRQQQQRPDDNQHIDDISQRRDQFEEQRRQRQREQQRDREPEIWTGPENQTNQRRPLYLPWGQADREETIDTIRQRRERYEERRRMRREYADNPPERPPERPQEPEEQQDTQQRPQPQEQQQPPQEQQRQRPDPQQPLSRAERIARANEAFGASASDIRALQEALHTLDKNLGPYGSVDENGRWDGVDGIHGRYTQGAWLSAQRDLGIDPPNEKYNPDIAQQIKERAAENLREREPPQPTQAPESPQPTPAPTPAPEASPASTATLSSWAGEALAQHTAASMMQPTQATDLSPDVQHSLAAARGDHVSHDIEEGQVPSTGTAKERAQETTRRV